MAWQATFIFVDAVVILNLAFLLHLVYRSGIYHSISVVVGVGLMQ